MKFFGLVLLALCMGALAQQQKYNYIFPDAPCAWGMKVETESAYIQQVLKVWVFGRYSKMEVYDFNDNLIFARVIRPDMTENGYEGTPLMFVYDGFDCYCASPDSDDMIKTYSDVLNEGDHDMQFDYLDEAKWNGDKGMVYYRKNATGNPLRGDIPDYNNAWYVNKKGYLVGVVEEGDKWDERVVTNITYYGSTRVTMGDFTFSERVVKCFDERVHHNPEAYWAHCAAGTIEVMFAVVIASVLAALVLVF